MRNKKAHEVALSGLLFALAIVLSMAESAITPLLGLAPGVKIGLANIVVMYAVFFMGARQALLLVVLILASTDLPKRAALYLEKNTFVRVVLKNAAIVAVFLLAVVYLVNGAYNPFLYFRF